MAMSIPKFNKVSMFGIQSLIDIVICTCESMPNILHETRATISRVQVRSLDCWGVFLLLEEIFDVIHCFWNVSCELLRILKTINWIRKELKPGRVSLKRRTGLKKEEKPCLHSTYSVRACFLGRDVEEDVVLSCDDVGHTVPVICNGTEPSTCWDPGEGVVRSTKLLESERETVSVKEKVKMKVRIIVTGKILAHERVVWT